MIPRYQQILFLILLVAVATMAFALFHMRQAAADRLRSLADTPSIAPAATAQPQDVKLWLANDADDTMSSVTRRIALPASPNAQARVLLSALLSDYSKPLSMHPLPTGATVDDVFFLPLNPTEIDVDTDVTPELAVVNLDPSFVEHHPSGITPEMLTIRSIVRTLHANLPQVRQVRFLVDGQPRPTLAGHADLDRSYSVLQEVPSAGDDQP